jgi:purine nucleosidase/pyrimidine-specific ribonucleoside hydrolase
MAERIIIDTDPGIDDALALLLALQSPEVDIAAITTVSGNVPVETGTRNVFKIFSLLPDALRPPVASGASRPIQKDPIHAIVIHKEDGLGGLDGCLDTAGNPKYASQEVRTSSRNGVDEILYQLSVTSEATSIIALGPLTNIAAAIEKDKETMASTKQIVLMGGAINVSGNVTPAAEFNIYADPHAAHIVFNSGIPLTVVGLDVTTKVGLTRDMIEEVVVSHPTSISHFLRDCTRNLISWAEEHYGKAVFFLHDPLAIGTVIDPSFVTTSPMHVEIETEGATTEGMTVADRRLLKPEYKKSPNANVCVEVDTERFLTFFMERLGLGSKSLKVEAAAAKAMAAKKSKSKTHS